MPLFKCSKCGCVSKTGKWHGEFAKDQDDAVLKDTNGDEYTFFTGEECPSMIIEKYIKEKK